MLRPISVYTRHFMMQCLLDLFGVQGGHQLRLLLAKGLFVHVKHERHLPQPPGTVKVSVCACVHAERVLWLFVRSLMLLQGAVLESHMCW